VGRNELIQLAIIYSSNLPYYGGICLGIMSEPFAAKVISECKHANNDNFWFGYTDEFEIGMIHRYKQDKI